ncbi:MAG: hypothetical protein Q9187_003539, partial [Circinaria calcarea]
MASSHHHYLFGSRTLLASTANPSRRTPSLLSTVSPRSSLRSPCLRSASRNFWWSRHGYTNRSCSSQVRYQRSLEAYQRIVKYRSGKGLQHISPRCKHHYLNQYSPTQGWRLSSLWGKPNGIWSDSNRLPKDKGTGEAEKKQDWRAEFQDREGEIANRFEAWRKKMEEDPYDMLFGKASERGLWNPFVLFETQASARPSSRPDSAQRNESNQRIQEHLKAGSSEEGLLHKGTGNDNAARNHKDISYGSPQFASARNTIESLRSRTSEPLEEYVIDPISMRKVPRRNIDSSPKFKTGSPNQSVNIPVKTYVQPKSTNTVTVYPSGIGEPSPPVHSGKSETRSSTTKSEPSSPVYHSTHPWLEREGFGVQADPPSNTTSANAVKNATPEPTATNSRRKIESSLDRHVSTRQKAKQDTINTSYALIYKPEENKTEDVDLLRASDVRARSGQTRNFNNGLQEAKLEQRQKLEDAFERRLQSSDLEDVEELTTRKAKQSASQSRLQADDTFSKLASAPEDSYLNKVSTHDAPVTNIDSWGYDLGPQNHLRTSCQVQLENQIQNKENSYAHVQQQIMNHRSEDNDASYKPLRQEREEDRPIGPTGQMSQEEMDQIRQDQLLEIQRQNKTRMLRDAAETRLAQEINTQKAAMNHMEYSKHNSSQNNQRIPPSQLGEGDMPENVHEFAGRDRWYKKKAPHATEQDAHLNEMRRKTEANGQSLVRELKDIYEDAYGAIDVNHPQAVLHPGMEGKEDPAVQRGLQEYDGLHTTMQNPISNFVLDNKFDHMFDHTSTSNEPKPDGRPNLPESTTKQIKSSISSEPARPAPPMPARISTTPMPSRNIYKILALNHSTHEVTSVTTTSSLHEQSSLPRSAPAILSHLSYPANFIPHLEALEGTDFELIAGNRNMLLYKKFNKAGEVNQDAQATKKDLDPANVPSSMQKTTMTTPAGGDTINSRTAYEELKGTARQPVNPIDGTTGRFASPTGFVNHDA